MLFTVLRSLTDVILVGAGTTSTNIPAGAGRRVVGRAAPARSTGAAIALVSARLRLDPDSQLLAVRPLARRRS